MTNTTLLELKSKEERLNKRINKISLFINDLYENTKNNLLFYFNENGISVDKITNNGDIYFYISNDNNDYRLEITNRNQNDLVFNPRVYWSSYNITSSNIKILKKYINLLNFITNEYSDINKSEFFKIIKNFYQEKDKLRKKYDELVRETNEVRKEINAIELSIKKEKFFSTYKNGNYYYKISERKFNVPLIQIYVIDKINNITSNIRCVSTTEANIDKLNYERTQRIRNDEIYDLLNNKKVFSSQEELVKMVTRDKIQFFINKLVKSGNEHIYKDFKLLCEHLNNNGIISSKKPDNDTLSMISEIRHYAIKYPVR